MERVVDNWEVTRFHGELLANLRVGGLSQSHKRVTLDTYRPSPPGTYSFQVPRSPREICLSGGRVTRRSEG